MKFNLNIKISLKYMLLYLVNHGETHGKRALRGPLAVVVDELGSLWCTLVGEFLHLSFQMPHLALLSMLYELSLGVKVFVILLEDSFFEELVLLHLLASLMIELQRSILDGALLVETLQPLDLL